MTRPAPNAPADEVADVDEQKDQESDGLHKGDTFKSSDSGGQGASEPKKPRTETKSRKSIHSSAYEADNEASPVRKPRARGIRKAKSRPYYVDKDGYDIEPTVRPYVTEPRMRRRRSAAPQPYSVDDEASPVRESRTRAKRSVSPGPYNVDEDGYGAAPIAGSPSRESTELGRLNAMSRPYSVEQDSYGAAPIAGSPVRESTARGKLNAMSRPYSVDEDGYDIAPVTGYRMTQWTAPETYESTGPAEQMIWREREWRKPLPFAGVARALNFHFPDQKWSIGKVAARYYKMRVSKTFKSSLPPIKIRPMRIPELPMTLLSPAFNRPDLYDYLERLPNVPFSKAKQREIANMRKKRKTEDSAEIDKRIDLLENPASSILTRKIPRSGNEHDVLAAANQETDSNKTVELSRSGQEEFNKTGIVRKSSAMRKEERRTTEPEKPEPEPEPEPKPDTKEKEENADKDSA
ncbi:MAG: hypothetical protein Q9160_007733 [Pyrenula sp. 1 TL-2023]